MSRVLFEVGQAWQAQPSIRSVQPALHGSTKPIVTIPMFVLRGNNFVEKSFAFKCFSICLLLRVLFHLVTLMPSDHPLSTKS